MQNIKQIPEPSQCDQARYEYKKLSYVDISEVLKSLRKKESRFCCNQKHRLYFIQLLIDFIYSGKIIIIEKNVEILLPSLSFLQLSEVNDICCDFLQAQLRITNCIVAYALADLHSCKKLLTSSELYIQQHFSDVVERDEFLFLSSEQVVNLISSDKINVPSEKNNI